jgi:uncharacterized protein (UPF0261 family)
MSIYLIATLDTKGTEIGYVRARLEALGLHVQIVDTGCLGEPAIPANISRDEVFRAGGASLDELRRRNDRGQAVTQAAEGAAQLVSRLHAEGKVDGVLGIGGSAGTTIATRAMRTLPLGVPKVMVSTLASGNVRGFVGDRDIVMINSVVDILGLNRISRCVLSEAAHAMAGMVEYRVETSSSEDRPLVAATMFGVTTPCIEKAREVLEAAGFEVLVFHATGNGGQAMESLILDGELSGVLDITTTELADEIVGGVLSAGPDRLTAAARRGVPQVVSVGATDMVNFHGIDTVPHSFRTRNLYKHNANVTLMRTTAEESARIGAEIGRKVSASQGPAAIVLPSQGVSAIDCAGQPFDDPEARERLLAAVRENAGDIEVIEKDLHINHPDFAVMAARKLTELIGE